MIRNINILLAHTGVIVIGQHLVGDFDVDGLAAVVDNVDACAVGINLFTLDVKSFIGRRSKDYGIEIEVENVYRESGGNSSVIYRNGLVLFGNGHIVTRKHFRRKIHVLYLPVGIHNRKLNAFEIERIPGDIIGNGKSGNGNFRNVRVRKSHIHRTSGGSDKKNYQ